MTGILYFILGIIVIPFILVFIVLKFFWKLCLRKVYIFVRDTGYETWVWAKELYNR